MSKKLLLVEDDKILAELLERKLKNANYEVAVAQDGEAGLVAMKANKPDLVLLDIIMPKKNGLEVMAEMNKDPELNLKQLPVVVISNSGQPVEIEKVLALGVRDYLIKADFDPQQVIDKVKKQIG